MENLATIEGHELENEYKAGNVVYRKAGLNDDESLKVLLREVSMDSWVRLSTEHEPSYFDSTELFGNTATIIASDDDLEQSIIGMCSSVSMPVYINGQATDAGYLGELRVRPEYRHKFSIIRNGFKSVQILNEEHQLLPYWFTSIAKENTAARRLLEANLKDMPKYRPCGNNGKSGELVTAAIRSKLGKRSELLEQAQESDIPALAGFYQRQNACYQYAPVISANWLRELNGHNGLSIHDFWLLKENGKIKAAFAIWDQRNIKQSVVRGYRFPLNVLRTPYNIYARVFGRVPLPAVGDQVNYIFIAFLSVSDDVEKHTKAILQSAISQVKTRKARLAMIGLSAKNPIFDIVEGFSPETYLTCVESVTWPAQTEQVLDERPVQPEIAIL